MIKSTRRISIAAYLLVSLSLATNIILGCSAGYWLYVRGGPSHITSKAVNGVSPLDGMIMRRDLYRNVDRFEGNTGLTVMFGDSLLAGGLWSEWYGTRNLNRAVGGETTADALARVGEISALHPDRVFILFGTNDFNVLSPEETDRNMRNVVQTLKRQSPNSQIFIESLLPPMVLTKEPWVLQVNRSWRRIAGEEHVHYVDLYPYFLEGRLMNPKLTLDGVHLSAQGYNLWRRLSDPYFPTQASSGR